MIPAALKGDSQCSSTKWRARACSQLNPKLAREIVQQDFHVRVLSGSEHTSIREHIARGENWQPELHHKFYVSALFRYYGIVSALLKYSSTLPTFLFSFLHPSFEN
jgi:hypothetical protein